MTNQTSRLRSGQAPHRTLTVLATDSGRWSVDAVGDEDELSSPQRATEHWTNLVSHGVRTEHSMFLAFQADLHK